MSRQVTPEYDKVVGAWAGFSGDKWNVLDEEVKDKFYEYYDKEQNPEEAEEEEE